MRPDSLGDRMKEYERASTAHLPRRMPCIIRVDGRAFHTLTRGCRKPFDLDFMARMDRVAIALCEQVQGAQLAYVQSDEVSVLVHDYKRIQSDAWFDKCIQKMVSIAASIATEAFNMGFGAGTGQFDARVFVLPESDVCNYFIWRMNDATRNSAQMVARSLYSHKELDGKKIPDLHEMCFARGVNWNDLPAYQKRGRCVRRFEVPSAPFDVARHAWRVDCETPIFTSDRAYIERLLSVEDETKDVEAAE